MKGSNMFLNCSYVIQHFIVKSKTSLFYDLSINPARWFMQVLFN